MDKNVLYCGDNLDVLRRHIKDETVDIVYLDPPFKSDQAYNILFAEKKNKPRPRGGGAKSKIINPDRAGSRLNQK
jgi:16S rRNA G966 N2-methylase RsmD